ncbi:MAG: sodium:proton antiporter [Candidatus Dormibacteraeota bacterium]|nr:sodium:proton antiporter [Candidatus Dormibacteraeota bacterium]
MIEGGVAGFVILLMAATAVAILVKRVPVPYVTALALVGLVGGALIGAHRLHLSHSLILFVLVPGLLFEAAFNLDWKHLRDNFIAVVALATLGVLVTTAVVAALGHFALGLSVAVAILFGAMVAPTDPVAVVAVFRRIGVPHRLANLVEAESLFNDGTGVVLFTIALAATTTAVSPWLGALQFLELAVGGIALGLAIGFGLSRLMARVDDPQVEITLTAIAAYGGYLLGESLHVSGLLTVVAAGLVLGNYGRPRAMSERTRSAVSVFWDYVAFVLNSVVFLLIGADVPWTTLFNQWWVVLGAVLAVLVARAVSVYGLLALLRPFGRHINLRWQHVIFWSGLRGAIAVALLLSLTQSGPEFDTVRALVYGVVLVSIIVQGLTIGPLARILLPHRGSTPDPDTVAA